MGLYSWKFADTNNKERLKVTKKAYVACPDGTFIEESSYNGYGQFGCYDIYELVAEWNREYLEPNMLVVPDSTKWGKRTDAFTRFGFRTYINSVQRIYDYRNNLSEVKMKEKYGKDWKREIGIDITCTDEQNEKLPFPIKIVKSTSMVYDELPASHDDPMQGCD